VDPAGLGAVWLIVGGGACSMKTLPSAQSSTAPKLVSVVLPVFNEKQVLARLVEEINAEFVGSCWQHEIVFVNDGSTDGSGEILDRLAADHS